MLFLKKEIIAHKKKKVQNYWKQKYLNLQFSDIVL